MSISKKLTPSKSLVKQSLRGHAWIGLFWSALLYLVCLSGALVVFFPEMERWEQPATAEYTEISDQSISHAVTELQKQLSEPVKSIYFVYSNEDIPRAHVTADDGEWWLNQDGEITEPINTPWTAFMTDLHIYLHLPNTLGILIIGMLGAMMCGLIISGLLAHPNLFKDAFKLRLGGNKQMQETDLHNRMSIWGLPFIFVVSFTGAYIGLFTVSLVVADYLTPEQHNREIVADVFGQDPVVNAPPAEIDIAAIHADIQQRAPQARLAYFVIQKPGTEQQFVKMAVMLPERLIFSEIYNYHSDGRFIDSRRYSDGDIGRQVAYSSYRVHFGHFGGYLTKFLYLVLGLAMAAVVVTGVNMWFEKRKLRNRWYYLWPVFVWATPAAMALTALLSLVMAINPLWSFWLPLLATCLAMLFVHHRQQQKTDVRTWVRTLKWLTLITMVIVVIAKLVQADWQLWYGLFGLGVVLLCVLPLIDYKKLFR